MAGIHVYGVIVTFGFPGAMVNLRGPALCAVLVFTTLAGCGGGDYPDTSNLAAQGETHLAPQSLASAMPASRYTDLVQQLYISYFGRAADPIGLSSTTAQLASIGAPSDIQGLSTAYDTNTTVRALVDAFGTSAESNMLYSGSTETFVTAIYRNVLNRAPDVAGLIFWVNAIDHGGLTRGHAALSIMASALSSITQSQDDSKLISNKITIASSFTSSLDTAAKIVSYSGDQAAATIRSMLSKISANTDTAAFKAEIDAAIGRLALSSLVANAGTAQSVTVGSFVTLDGSGSYSGDGHSITYGWQLASKPSASKASIVFAASSRAYISIDVAGTYVATLTINNGFQSKSSSVTITATSITTTYVPPTTGTQTATAICKDGTYSYSTTHSGTCSSHGGVSVWL